MEDTTSTKRITRFDVFVPGSFPQYSYVRRTFKRPRTGEEFDPEIQIREALNQPGMIAQVVGPSKSGKTRAIENCVGLDNLITIAGSQISENLSLWEIVLRTIKAPVSTESATSSELSMGGEAKAKASAEFAIASLESELTAKLDKSNGKEETLSFATDPFQVATKELRDSKKVLFLDDFHTIPEEIQSTVAAQLKAAAQIGVKICLAEVPHHSDSTISALPDLTGRVYKIEFQYWNTDDLISIGKNGFEQLNAHYSPAGLSAFAMEAAGSPQLMQLICLNAAAHAHINEKSDETRAITIDLGEVRTILINTHSTVDRERIFNILDRGPDERGSRRNRYPVRVLGTGDNYEIALAVISLTPPATELTWNSGQDNIATRIDKVCTNSSKKPAKAQITRALEQMQALAEKNMPRQPIIEWNAATGLHILDPYFLFHLRWSEKYERLRG